MAFSKTTRPSGLMALLLKLCFIFFLAISLPLSAQPEDYPVPWINNFTLPPQDSDGWSIIAPSGDSRLIYVSSSEGNDSTGRVYSISDPEVGQNYQNPGNNIRAFATVSAAQSQLRAGYPDFILFKRGDTFSNGIIANRGRSASERSVATWYGTSVNRPLFRTRGSESAVTFRDNSNFAVIGLEFRAFQRNPNSSDFVGFSNVGTPQSISAVSGGGLSGILIEDCLFEWYDQASISAYNGPPLTDFILRRNLILNSYPDPGGHAQGIYSAITSVFLEGNVFDHNGWYERAGGNGAASLLSHNIYFSHARDSIFRKNIFLRPSSINMKFASHTSNGQDAVTSWNILIDNNLLVDAEVGISLGGNADNNNGYRWRNIHVVNNVMSHNGMSHQTNRILGWGLDVSDWESGSIRGNVFTTWGDRSTITYTYALNVVGHTGSLVIDGNKFYDVSGGTGNDAMLRMSGLVATNRIDITNNDFIQPSPSGQGVLVSIPGSSAINLSGNRYYSTNSNRDDWFSGGQIGSSGGQSAIMGMPRYVEPDRTVFDYLQRLGYAPTIDAMVSELKRQSKLFWREELTAEVINEYIREGFCIQGQNCEAEAGMSPPLPPNNLSVDLME